ncbi:MAG: biotin-dependent carboxyltransferase family protein, partial [Stellaceae bacterium]
MLAPGLHTTVQDLGRIGWQMQGVPVSGALDGLALRLGNALVGNWSEMAAIEILYSGPTLEVAADLVRVAVAGIGAGLLIESQGRRALPAWQSIALPRGEVFRLAPGPQSVCAYLAVEGGIAVPSVLGSASTLARAGLGGFNGRALREGDLVPLAIGRVPPRAELRLPHPPAADSRPIRIVLGPQQEYFTDEAMVV